LYGQKTIWYKMTTFSVQIHSFWFIYSLH
jgi:hypothetical protein